MQFPLAIYKVVQVLGGLILISEEPPRCFPLQLRWFIFPLTNVEGFPFSTTSSIFVGLFDDAHSNVFLK